MIITQPARTLIAAQMIKFGSLLCGDLLDVGAGSLRRYQCCFPRIHTYRTLDVNANSGADIIGSAESIPLPDASVGNILCTQVLEHVPHPWLAIQEMYRVLRPNGLLLLTVPQMNELHEIPHDYYRYTNYGLRQLLQEAGFEVRHLEQSGSYHSLIAQVKIRHWVNRLQPYSRMWALWILAPITYLYTQYALWMDRRFPSEEASWHAIGWCVVAEKKPHSFAA